jgi:TetR/AcrR family transcriptional regulator, transcriptional repressor for nem operon
MKTAKPGNRKNQTREKILAAGSKLLKRQGIKSASVANVMAEAGLTVGGFYAHFDSKENLVSESFRYALRESSRFMLGSLPQRLNGNGKLKAFFRAYLSPQHRDSDKDGQGCPLAALADEMGKGSASLHKVFTAELEKMAAECAQLFSDRRFTVTPEEFLTMMSTAIGGLALARATRGSVLSDRILQSCFKQLATLSQDKEEMKK